MTAPELPTERKAASDRSLLSNIIAGSGARMFALAAGLLVSPVIVAHLGLRDYGFWALLQGLVLYIQVADGGFPAAATAMVGRARTTAEVQRIVSVVATTMLVVSVVVVSVALAFALALPASLSASFPVGWEVAAVAVGVAVSMTMLGNAFASGVAGLERWDLDATAVLAGQLVMATGTIGALALGGELASVGVALAAGTVAFCSIQGFNARRLGSLSGWFSNWDRPTFRALWGQGVSLQIVAFSAATTAQADRYMLLAFAPLEWIGAYDLGARAALGIKTLPTSALGPLITRIASIHGDGGFDAVRSVYPTIFTRTARYGVGSLIVAYGAGFAAVLVWLGTEYTVSATVAVVLGAGYAFNFMTAPGTSAARASGRASLERDYTVLMLIVNVVGSVILGLLFGRWGVVAATTLGLVIGSCWLIVRVDRWMDFHAVRVLLADRSTSAALLAATVVAVASVIAALVAEDLGRPGEAAVVSATLIAGSFAVAGLLPARHIVALLQRRGTRPRT